MLVVLPGGTHGVAVPEVRWERREPAELTERWLVSRMACCGSFREGLRDGGEGCADSTATSLEMEGKGNMPGEASLG